MLTAGIRFDDCYFSEPTPLSQWTPPRCAGLFVVLAPDSNWAPKPYQPLHFGEFGNNATHIPDVAEFGLLRGAASTQPLYISALAMPFSTTAQRRAIRAELVQAYNPISRASEPRQELPELPGSFHLHGDAEPRRRIGFLP
jgi:hypothetical protein